MFDVFYIGKKPGMFPHEQEALSISHAQTQSRTRYCWIITYLADYTDWDFLWEPPPWQGQFVHTWPSQWHQFSGTYLVPKSLDDISYHFHDRVIPNRARPEEFVTNVPGAEFDWTWSPHPLDPPYDYVFGNQWWPAQTWSTVEYRVPGSQGKKFIDNVRARLPMRPDAPCHLLYDCEWDHSWQPDPGDPPYIYVFGNQWWPAEKMPTVEYRVPGAVDKKFMSWPRAALKPDATGWTIPEGLDPDTIDLTWRPDPGAPPYVYQFSTQHQKTGGPVYRVPGATEVKYVDQVRATIKASRAPVYVIDHMDGRANDLRAQLKNRVEIQKTSRYVNNYLDTLRRIAAGVPSETEFIWIVSSICDYTDFDFTWYPEQWQSTMLHVFPSGDEKFGDTFFMHVPSFRDKIGQFALLEWYDNNFVSFRSVPRHPMPIIEHDFDSHVDAVKTQDFQGPLALFKCKSVTVATLPMVSLWRDQTKTVVPLTPGASAVILPRDAVPDVSVQIYDYPYINKRYCTYADDLQQDVIFISNGEPMAQENWQHLKKIFPAAKHSQGVLGREAAYKAAAAVSDTPWFFAVFAKTEVLPEFDFTFQPDRLQAPKHYIFHSRNPLNRLEYGAMNINLYNKQLTLDTVPGLDFTLSAAHEVVPICASISRFNTDPWITWRSAFREVLKLKQEVDRGADVEIQHRLNVWCTYAEGQNSEHCLQGARDALRYYDSVQGDDDKLRLSFDWAWLQDHYYQCHGSRPWLESV